MRVRWRVLLCFVLMLLLATTAVWAQGPPADRDRAPEWAQGPPDGMVVWPDSSVERAQDIGKRAHTNHLILWVPLQTTGPTGMAPSVIRAAYGLPTYTLGQVAGSQVIAIVDAFDYPSARTDFNAFSAAFGLPQETGSGSVFQVVYASGTQPSYNSGWSQEAALDIEWAHATAPTAKIVLVEAASNSFADLLTAVNVAGRLTGVREVSMSWGGSEFSSESLFDSYFTAANVVYFAASGDSGGKVIWPSASPNVVSCGGTTLNVSSTGAFVSETAWSGGGGGPSRYEARPSYQNVIQTIVKNSRGTPDLAFDANPNTGVSVNWQGAWYVFGGTSVSTPSLAGVVNLAASTTTGFALSTADELGNRAYANLSHSSPTPTTGSDFRDIVSGSAGRYKCTSGWDFVTGIGSDWGRSGK